MKLSGGKQYQFNQLKDEIHMALAHNTFPSTIFNTVNHIIRVINAIRQTRGINWARTIQDNGQPVFTPIEQQRYTELLQPYIPAILGFFEEPNSDGVQKGGVSPITTVSKTILPEIINTTNIARSALAPGALANKAASVTIDAVKDVETVATEAAMGVADVTEAATGLAPGLAAMPIIKPSKPSKMTKLQNSLTSGISDKIKGIDLSSLTPDMLFDKIMSTYQGINRSMNETMDAVHFEKEVDEKADIPLGQTGVMITPRFIIFLIYYILDITRVAISINGNETGRKLLSIVVAILDLVRGDWKKAILTFVGYYGSSPLLIGQALKTYLTVIQLLSPTVQIKIPYFMYDSAKSMVFGILLSIIQIGAPKQVRDQLEELLTTLSDVQRDIDAKLNALTPPLSSRPDYFKVDFSNLSDLQAILDDPVYICSKEHRDAINKLLTNAKEGVPMIQFILSLMRYPHTRGMTQYLCDSNTKKSYVDLLVEEGLKREGTEEGIAKADTKADTKANPKEESEVSIAESIAEPGAVNTKGGTRSKKRLLRMKALLTSK